MNKRGGGRVGKIPNIDKSELLVKYTKVFAEGYKCKNTVQNSTSPEAKFFRKFDSKVYFYLQISIFVTKKR